MSIEKESYLSVIVYTVLQELFKARESHPSEDVRNFASEVIKKVEYEAENWKFN